MMLVVDIIGGTLAIIIAGWLGWTSRTLDQHGEALAVLISEVKPQNSPPLREIVSAHGTAIAVNRQRITQLEKDGLS